ncbi:MAG TPA: hypothetical protein VJP77_08080 [Planctomycetota bacterium]|nr:hypothetical protein [Planctomycetota bacterium]
MASSIATLVARREKLRAELAKVDQEIAARAGEPHDAGSAPRKG